MSISRIIYTPNKGGNVQLLLSEVCSLFDKERFIGKATGNLMMVLRYRAGISKAVTQCKQNPSQPPWK